MKKILKYLGLGLALLIIVFFSLGIFIPTITFSTKTEMNSTRVHAFTVFTDMSKMGKWMPGFKRIELVSGFPYMKGSVYRITLVRDGREYILLETLLVFRPGWEFTFELDSEVLTAHVQVLFKERNRKTSITAFNEVTGKNIFWKSAFVFYKSWFTNTQRAAFTDLGKLIEQVPDMKIEE